jgi:hypothetical protein
MSIIQNSGLDPFGRWVSERLGMGDESRVSQAIRRVQQPVDPGLARLKKQIEQAEIKTAACRL